MVGERGMEWTYGWGVVKHMEGRRQREKEGGYKEGTRERVDGRADCDFTERATNVRGTERGKT